MTIYDIKNTIIWIITHIDSETYVRQNLKFGLTRQNLWGQG